MKIVGENTAAEKTHRVLTQLLELSRRGNTITEQNVDYAISLVFEDQEEGIVEIDRDLICHTLQGKPIKPKTLGQKKYVDSIREGTVSYTHLDVYKRQVLHFRKRRKSMMRKRLLYARS